MLENFTFIKGEVVIIGQTLTVIKLRSNAKRSLNHALIMVYMLLTSANILQVREIRHTLRISDSFVGNLVSIMNTRA